MKSRRVQTTWTPEKRTVLRTLWHQGVPLKMIAYQIGVTVGSCKAERGRMGLALRKVRGAKNIRLHVVVSDEQYAEVRKAMLKGKYSTVAQYIRVLLDRDVSSIALGQLEMGVASNADQVTRGHETPDEESRVPAQGDRQLESGELTAG